MDMEPSDFRLALVGMILEGKRKPGYIVNEGFA